MGKTYKIDPCTYEPTSATKSYGHVRRKREAKKKVMERRIRKQREKVFNGRYYFEEHHMECGDSGALPEEQS